MYIHKEGRRLLFVTFVILLAIYAAMIFTVQHWNFFHYLFIIILLGLWCALAFFFRIPRRVFTEDEERLISPADGTLVTSEETYEKEYLKEECIQLSVFMYGTDVHVNRYPCSGTVEYVKYHKGNYFVASYPKSSVLNEHSSIGLRLDNGHRILIRQVAGVMARRIVCYAREGERVKQNQELGFIKFGSRVDLFIPKTYEIEADLQDAVRNAITPLARIK
ncbi:MAG: phosphatidylserine decarboxylase family protein [Bacteroidales bacterium]|nr:phosphatidylserine decarboxylase family protein [Candidatus Colimorpha pelethequi]MCQ2262185.1 phosphatidylserine decarboxylase family protein [Bacteroidales bacterium]